MNPSNHARSDPLAGRRRHRVCRWFALALTLSPMACAETTITAVAVNSVRIDPDSVTLHVGASAPIAAAVLDTEGNTLVGRAITWSSADPSIARVDQRGMVTAVGLGHTTVTARSDGAVGVADVWSTAPPKVRVQPSRLGFVMERAGADPAAQTALIVNEGDGTVLNLTAVVDPGSDGDGDWLALTLDRTSAPATLRVDVNGSGLAEGRHSASIRVGSSNGGVSHLEVVVDVFPPPAVIQIDRNTVTFEMVEGGPRPAPESAVVTSAGGALTGLGASVTYAASQPEGWLAVSLSPSTAPSTLGLSIANSDLRPGTYMATVLIVSSMAAGGLAVDVRLTVAPRPPSIALSARTVSFSAVAGAGDPSPRFVTVANGGGGTLSGLDVTVAYPAGTPTGWFSAVLTASDAPSSLILRAGASGLTSGTYTALVHVSSPMAADGTKTIAITLVVDAPADPPSIQLSTATIDFVAVAGAADPAAQTVSVTNGGSGSLTGLATTVSYATGEPTGWLGATLSASDAPASLVLRASVAGLPAGTYTAAVDVGSPSVPAGTQTIVVTLVVNAAPAPPSIQLSTATIDFVAVAGAADPAAQTIAVTNGGSGSLTGLVTTVSYATGEPTGWLSATLSSGTAPATIAVAATVGSLPPGRYSATIVVSSAGINAPPSAPVAVTLTVSPPAPPKAPTNLKASGKKGGQIEASWDDNSDNETRFVLQHSRTGGAPWTDVVLPADTEKYRLNNLTKGDLYYFRVMACIQNSCSVPSNVDSDTAG